MTSPDTLLSKLTCADCSHHHDCGHPSYGECRAVPPARPVQVSWGLTMRYVITEDTLPACGSFTPKPLPNGLKELETRKPSDLETRTPAIETRQPAAPAQPMPKLGPGGAGDSAADRERRRYGEEQGRGRRNGGQR